VRRWFLQRRLVAHPPDFTVAGRLGVRSLDPAPTTCTSVSAGPPLGGLYLKPPSSGGLCEGVITMPSAEPLSAVPGCR
jgi:hypothetical protein